MHWIRTLEEEEKQMCRELYLLADPSQKMIDEYLGKSLVYVVEWDGRVVGEAALLPLKKRSCELKNLAVEESCQGKGIGSALVQHLLKECSLCYDTMYVGTSEKGIAFYEKNGFSPCGIAENFFLDHYDTPIYEDGVRCDHMYYLKKNL